MKNRLETYYGTAIWKIDTPFENWLGKKADKSEFFKRLYVLYYKIFDKEYYQKGLKMIDDAISDFKINNSDIVNRLSEKELKRDMIYTLHRFGADFQEYFVFEYYARNTFGREEFITNKRRYKYYHLLNSDENFLLFEDKKRTYEIFKEYYGRDVLPVDTTDDKQLFLEFTAKHTTFMYKPVGGAEGRGIQKVTVNSAVEAETFFDNIINKGRFLAEELIIQDERMAALHKESVNTVRVPAIICKGKVKIFHPFFRVGMGNAVVDNNGFGGIAASVDAETGIVYTRGLTKKGHWYVKHPDTNVPIVGFQIPEWNALIELTEKMTPMVEGTRYIAWDFALTEKGWVVVEANALGGVCPLQGQDKIGRKYELLELINMGK